MEKSHKYARLAPERQCERPVEQHRSGRDQQHEPKRGSKVSRNIPTTDTRQSRLDFAKSIDRTALSGDNDYVRKWIAETERETNAENERMRQTSRTDDVVLKPHQLHDGTLAHYREDTEHDHSRQRIKRRRNSSSDSSLLEASKSPHPTLVDRGKDKTGRTEVEYQRRGPLKRHKDKPGSSSSDLSPVKKIYEKRARHKTKEERYEPKKTHNPEKGIEKKRSSTKTQSKRGQKKVAKNSGGDLARNFSSKSIGHERLTIRPSSGLGLFRNGRASSPARRRGLPDLAFSEMDFLNRSEHNPKPDKITSKSREKEIRKATNVQEEISAFFKPRKVPLRERDPRGRATSVYSTYEESLYGKQIAVDEQKHSSGQSQAPKQHLSRSNHKSLTERSQVTQHISHEPSLAKRLRSQSRLSGQASTYITWSESRVSPSRTIASHQRNNTHQRYSTTPESVRRALDDTGIYRDTGIGQRQRYLNTEEASKDGRFKECHSLANVRSEKSLLPKGNLGTNLSETSSPMTSSKYSTSRSPYHPSEDIEISAAQVSTNLDFLKDVIQTGGQGISPRQTTKPAVHMRQRIVIEHFDPVLGWHRRSSPKPQERSSSPKEPSKAATDVDLVNREELAKLARIRRPPTTLAFAQANQEDGADNPGTRITTETPKDSQQASSAKQIVLAHSLAIHHDRESLPRATQYQGFPPSHSLSDTQGIDARQNDPPPYHVSPAKEQIGRHLTEPRPEVRPHIDPASEIQEPMTIVENGSYLGLPIRGGWEIQHSIPQDQCGTSPAFAEAEPMFINQVQRQNTSPEERLAREVHTKNDILHGLPPSTSEDNLLAEETGRRFSPFENRDQIIPEGDYCYQLDNENYGEEEVQEMDTYDTYHSDYNQSDFDELETTEAAFEERESWPYYSSLIETQGQPGHAMVPVERHDGLKDAGKQPIQGFWKPQRQY